MNIPTTRNEILTAFIELGSPCAIWEPKPVESILNLLKSAVEDGLLRSAFGSTATSGVNLWTECLILTDEGRVACGMKPLTSVVKKKTATLFD